MYGPHKKCSITWETIVYGRGPVKRCSISVEIMAHAQKVLFSQRNNDGSPSKDIVFPEK